MPSIAPARRAAPLLVALLALSVAGCALTGISRSDEIRLGQQTAAEIERRYRTHEDPTLTRLGLQLAALSGRADLPWRFRVIEQKDVNAFSLPGGPIYITSGMVAFTRSQPDQLAAVTAHEIAHIAQRHVADQIQRQAWLGLGIGVLTSGSAQTIATLAANLEELGFSRNQEREADTYGAAYLVRAGMDPLAMAGLMERLEKQSGGGGASFLRTHPSGGERAARIRQQVQSGEIRRLAQQGS